MRQMDNRNSDQSKGVKSKRRVVGESEKTSAENRSGGSISNDGSDSTGYRRTFLKATGLATVASGMSIGSAAKETAETKRKDWPKADEKKKIQQVGYHDLDDRPGFKMGIWETNGEWYLYVGHLFHSGWSVLNVTDPRKPIHENFIEGPPDTWTLQMQTIDGRLITNYEQPGTGWDPAPGNGPPLDENGDFTSGIGVWDATADPTDPQQQGFYDIDGPGSHRNHYDGGDLVFGHAEFDGWDGAIMVILDISDPTNPTELSRAWWPGQAPGEEPSEELDGLHGPPYPDAGENPQFAYLSYGDFGMVTADVSDPANPELVDRVDFGDVGRTGLGCHTAVQQPGTDIVWSCGEALDEGFDEVWTCVFAIDKSDPESDHIQSILPTPTPSSQTGWDNYVEKGGRFGPHNTNHFQYNDDYYNPSDTDVLAYAWFNAGLRLFDVSDPFAPQEVGYFVPEDPETRLGTQPEQQLVTQSEDVLIDARGYIYVSHKNQGIHILKSPVL